MGRQRLAWRFKADERQASDSQPASARMSTSSANPEDPSRTAAVSALATVADAVGYARACHDAAERIFRALSEDDVVRPVNSPFGTYPAWQYLMFAYDEHWHHRGQLYTYLRLLGKEPPMLYDYQVNAG